MVRVLLIGEAVEDVEGKKVFGCAATCGSIWHALPQDAFEMYSETRQDGWDLVIVDCKEFSQGMQIAQEINALDSEQRILVMHSKCDEIQGVPAAVCAPRRFDVLAEVFKLRAFPETCGCSPKKRVRFARQAHQAEG